MYKAFPAACSAAFSAVFSLLYCQAAQAQQVVAGTVADKDNKPLEAVSVALLKAADSTWLQSALTGADGGFSFKEASAQALLINVQAAGYLPFYAPVQQLTGIAIRLQPRANELKEVVVKSKAPVIQNGLGMLTVNFDEAAAPAGGNALDLLKKAPGVMVGGNGSISMNGKGVLVVVNGKRTYLSGEDLNNYLKSLPAEDVAQIELMGQPAAKYDAEGNTGIINIKTKKNKKEGLNGAVSASYGQTKYPGTYNTANLNYRKEKLSLYAKGIYFNGMGYLNQEQERRITNANGGLSAAFNEKSFLKERFQDDNADIGGEYTLTEQLSLGGNLQGVYHTNTEKDRTTATITDYTNQTVTYNEAENNRGFLRKQLHGNGYLRYQPKKDQELSLDIDGILYHQADAQVLTSNNYDGLGKPLFNNLALRSSFPQGMSVWVGKADYTGAFAKDLKIEAGLKSSFRTSRNDAVYYTLDNNSWNYNTTLSNYYTYHENINAAYASIGKKLSAKWQAQLGLRAEQTNLLLNQQVNNQAFDRHFVNIFPTGFLSWQATEKHTLELNFGRRIERPSYRSLNPFLFYTSQYSYSSGNPYLLPSFRNSIVLKHSYRNMLITEVSYARVYDIATDLLLYDAATKTTHQQPQNIANKQNVHASVVFNKELYSWWQFSSSYDCYYNDYKDSSHNTIIAQVGHSFGISNEFNYKTWTFNTYYSFNSADLQSLTERSGANQWMHGSIAKKIWNDSATIKLRVDDPFDVCRWKSTTDWNGMQTTSVSQYATQGFNISFAYRFGKQADVKKREQAVEEERRM